MTRSTTGAIRVTCAALVTTTVTLAAAWTQDPPKVPIKDPSLEAARESAGPRLPVHSGDVSVTEALPSGCQCFDQTRRVDAALFGPGGKVVATVWVSGAVTTVKLRIEFLNLTTGATESVELTSPGQVGPHGTPGLDRYWEPNVRLNNKLVKISAGLRVTATSTDPLYRDTDPSNNTKFVRIAGCPERDM